jgi:hypothetical protein
MLVLIIILKNLNKLYYFNLFIINISWVIKTWFDKSSIEANIPIITIIIYKKILLYKLEIKTLVFLFDILLIKIINYLGSFLRSRGIDLVLLVSSKAKYWKVFRIILFIVFFIIFLISTKYYLNIISKNLRNRPLNLLLIINLNLFLACFCLNLK